MNELSYASSSINAFNNPLHHALQNVLNIRWCVPANTLPTAGYRTVNITDPAYAGSSSSSTTNGGLAPRSRTVQLGTSRTPLSAAIAHAVVCEGAFLAPCWLSSTWALRKASCSTWLLRHLCNLVPILPVISAVACPHACLSGDCAPVRTCRIGIHQLFASCPPPAPTQASSCGWAPARAWPCRTPSAPPSWRPACASCTCASGGRGSGGRVC